jgi:hypothetical protein
VPGYDLKKSIANPNPSPEAQFGYAVAVVGGNVLVGAPFDDAAATDAGAAYLFDGTSGALLRTFQSPNPQAGDWFGIAVSAVGNNVLVGAVGDNTGAEDAGAAYLFDGATGALLHAFQKPTPAAADWFGGAVAAAGENVLVGAPLDDLGGTDAGAAYLFDGKSGALLQTFRNPTPDKDDWFGVALAALGNHVLVGAMQDDAAGKDAGAVHLFDATSGALVKSHPHPGGKAGDWFGVAITPFGRDFLVGAPFNDAGAKDAGWVYLVDGTTGAWKNSGYANQVPASGDQFGRALAVAGERGFIGSPGTSDLKPGGGVWLLEGTITSSVIRNPTGKAGAQFGFSVAAAGNLLVVGAPTDDAGETHSGSVHLFRAQ